MYNRRPRSKGGMIMSTSPKKAVPSKKADAIAPVSRRDIEQQVKLFIKSGGAITKIPNGVSGQQNLLPTRKHIVITKKKV